MSSRKSCFLRSTSNTAYNHNHQLTLVILWGLVFVLLFGLVAFAFVQLEYDELPSLDDSSVVSAKGRYFPGSFLSGFQLAVSAVMLRFEYLRGHIGEKRFAGRTIQLVAASSIGKFFATAQPEPSFVLIPFGKDYA